MSILRLTQVLSLAHRSAWGVCHEEDYPHTPGLLALAAHCPQLRSVDAEACSWVTEAALLALAAGCSGLESLTVSEPRAFTDEVRGGGATLLSVVLFASLRAWWKWHRSTSISWQ